MIVKPNVLIVEDRFILFDYLAGFFEKRNCTIVSRNRLAAVDNYATAIELLQETPVDLALLDISIKGKKDGIDIAGFIRQHYDIPIIFLSDFNTGQNIDRATQYTDLFFPKPFDDNLMDTTYKMLLAKILAHAEKRTTGAYFMTRSVLLNARSVRGSSERIDSKRFIRWDDIYKIESYNSAINIGNNQLRIFLTDNQSAFLVRMTLKSMLHKLPDSFARFSRSLIVNLKNISSRQSDSVYCRDSECFTVQPQMINTVLKKARHYLPEK